MSRAHALANHPSNERGSSGTSSLGTGMGAAHTFSTTSPIASPSNGTLPQAAANAHAPSDQISDAGLTGADAVKASGLMKSGVPSTMPVLVVPTPPTLSSCTTLAMP